MRRTGYFLLFFLSLSIATYAIAVYGFLPLGTATHPDLRVTFEAHSFGIYVHIFAAVVALAIGPFQFSSRLRTKHTKLHRWLGRLYLGIGVLFGGLAGLYMSTYATGGVVARLGFASLALAWLYTGLRAFLSIRARDIASHRRWMTRNFALTFAAVTLRLYLPASMVAGVAFELAYPIIAWLCWVPNIVAAELLVSRTQNNPA
jgi:uncharacterized membrane protein